MKDYTNGPVPGFFRLWWNNGAAFVVFLSMFVPLLTYTSYQALKQGLVFEARGVVVEATITDRRENTVRRDDGTDTDYYVTFDYMAGGAAQSVEKKVGPNLYRSLAPGTVRDIRYLSDRPSQMEHTVGRTWWYGYVAGWISFFLGVGTLAGFWGTARPAIEAIRARKFGRAEWATVQYVAERKKNAENGSGVTYVLVWTDREYRQGESIATASQERYGPYRTGTKIEVYRDSRGKTWWVGDVGPRAVAPTVPDAGKPAS